MASFAAVNINTADAETLQKELKGIGQEKAEAIVAYRLANGNFKSADELTNVKGVGIKTVDKNRDNIVLQTPASSK
ncbi:MAG: helix-hairpin-helix domain-containing protein [Gammaproteobacteria bacterium]|nr:helix-hairpin-helix domain-containing protein [Gammaproteobacteria bacterium]